MNLSVIDEAKVVEIMCEATSYFIQPNYAEEAVQALYAAGYRIVHPDNVPRRKVWPDDPSPWEPNGDDQARGWNACRAHIFRDAP